jgi:hypothetical protein
MSRTTLCLLTAGSLAALSLGVMLLRYAALGGDVPVPSGHAAWKVTLRVHGQADADARLLTATPLDFGRQHVVSEQCASPQFLDKPPAARHPERRQVQWALRGEAVPGPFRARYEFICVTDAHPSAPMTQLHKDLYAAPKPGEHLDVHPRDGDDHDLLLAQARRLTAGLPRPIDQAQAVYRFVAEEIVREPSLGGPSSSAAECLQDRSGDARARSRLLTALLRSRGIPTRMVTGLTLAKGPEQLPHYWVEAWVQERWLPMCPCYQHFGSVPASYLVFGFGDMEVVRSPGGRARDLSYAFLVEHVAAEAAGPEGERSWLQRAFLAVSLYRLPPPEQRLVEFLLLLPAAALVICVYRNLIGLHSFGTFAPALVGLCFRDMHSLPGMLVFVGIILVGWLMRRLLDRYHLLQVPRVAVMLSLVVVMLITAIVLGNFHDMPATKYISLFPLVILTGMIERFWTLETEDSTVSSFKTLIWTLLIAATIAAVTGLPALAMFLFRFPEALGLIVACQLLIGRYTGYRLTELFRFRDFLKPGAVT